MTNTYSDNPTTPPSEPTDATIPSYTTPLIALEGASLPQDDTDIAHYQGVAWHYGNPLVEQRVFENGAGIVDRSHRRFLAVSGPDAPTFLNNLLSQKLDDAPEDFSAQGLNLDAQGHILQVLDITKRGDTFYIDVPAPEFKDIKTYLERMIFWSQVEITTPDYGIVSLVGPDAQQVLDTLEIEPVFSRTITQGVPRIDLVLPRSELLSAARQAIKAGAHPTGLMAYTAERIKALDPTVGLDLDQKSIPHESPVLLNRAVHLNKGCYRGQETVARVDNLGRAPRALVLLQLDGSAPELPSPGDEITSHGRTVGRVGSVTHDMDFGPIALALVKRSALHNPDLEIAGTAVTIDPDTLPNDDVVKPGRAAIDKLKGK